MKPAVNIQTPDGLDYYYHTNGMFDDHKRTGLLKSFTEMLTEERKRVDDEIELFLEDDVFSRKYKMNDTDMEGWAWWKTMADYSATLRHFERRGQYESKNN